MYLRCLTSYVSHHLQGNLKELWFYVDSECFMTTMQATNLGLYFIYRIITLLTCNYKAIKEDLDFNRIKSKNIRFQQMRYR